MPQVNILIELSVEQIAQLLLQSASKPVHTRQATIKAKAKRSKKKVKAGKGYSPKVENLEALIEMKASRRFLNTDGYRLIWDFHRQGFSNVEIARAFPDFHPSTIYRIIQNIASAGKKEFVNES